MRYGNLAAVFCVFAGMAGAELQNVEIGGSIEIYGAWYTGFYEKSADGVMRIPDTWLPNRAIGPYGTVTYVHSDRHGNNLSYVQERTRLRFTGDMTGRVRAVIELDSIETWGEDFRSDYRTGADFAADSSDDVEIFQSYIEAEEMGGLPLRLRIGRQELEFGSGWLVGTNPLGDPFTGLSFDAVRATYGSGPFTIDAWTSKLQENGSFEEDGDVDFHGLYATYAFTPDIVLDAYWMWVRDGRSLNDTNFQWPAEWLENAFGLDDYDPTNLHTVGARTAGAYGAWDWELEGAYQFGNADAVGQLFPLGTYGDDGAEFDSWAAHGEVGYTFEQKWSPRVYTGGSYYSGEDNRDVTVWEWLNPFHRSEASVSFNRLFSDVEVDYFLCGSALTNFWEWHGGVTVAPTEKLELDLCVQYQQVVEPFDRPLGIRLGRYDVPVIPEWPFVTRTGAKDLGWQAMLSGSYAYTEDLIFDAGYTYYFLGDAVEDGSFIDENGLRFVGGESNDDAQTLWGQCTIKF